MMRFLADTAVSGNAAAAPDARVLSGLGDVCADIQQCARNVRHSLDVDALDTELGDAERERTTQSRGRAKRKRQRKVSKT